MILKRFLHFFEIFRMNLP